MPEPILLTTPEAACLEALCRGTERTVLIALQAGLNLKQTAKSLATLASLDLAEVDVRRKWHLTPHGKTVEFSIAPPVPSRGRRTIPKATPGPSATRLLELLDRPRRGADLATMLGVTRQRIDQLVVALSAFGLIRSADPSSPIFVVARRDDPSILLRADQERALSAFPDTEATTLSKIAVAVNMPAAKVASIAELLRAAGLIEQTGTGTYGDLYRLTTEGSMHWQRSAATRRADTPPLPFRSDRVRAVLTCLESRGPIRTRDVGQGLGISPTSINALMQYLKRRNTVRTHTDARHAPYELTPDGRKMLAAMRGRAGNAAE
jgi:DNA-binding IclR family transcriptional regulator